MVQNDLVEALLILDQVLSDEQWTRQVVSAAVVARLELQREGYSHAAGCELLDYYLTQKPGDDE